VTKALLVLSLATMACERKTQPPQTTVDSAASLKQSVRLPEPDSGRQVEPPVLSPGPSPSRDTSGPTTLDSVTAPLELPAAMDKVLKDSLPGFVAWSMAHYHPEVQSWAHQYRKVPWAVFGDFNRDRIVDVVADGTDGERLLRIVLMSNGPTHRLLVLRAGPLTEQVLQNSDQFLAYQQPPIDSGSCDEQDRKCRDQALHLAIQAFEVVIFEKASVLYWWTGDRFAEEVTSD
jgi:hypothetical protein